MEDENNIPTLISIKPLKSEFINLQKISVTSERFTIGRSIGNSVVIPFLPISRLHCTFSKSENNEWFISDNSTFGIHVNNKKLQKGYQTNITDGDMITLDPTAEFVYKFFYPNNAFVIPKKRIKREKSTNECSPVPNTDDIVDDVKLKFEESQNYEIKHIEEKIQSAKQLQTTTIILKQQLQADMDRRTQKLKDDFAQQIENVKGEKDEVEKQKLLLIKERDEQVAQLKNEKEAKISELMEQIQKLNETESELLKENNQLKEKLEKEREVFFSELNKENSSKQELWAKLEAQLKEQQEARCKEKLELEERLLQETEKLRLAQEKELKELAEQKRLRELELEQEHTNATQKLQDEINKIEHEQSQKEELYKQKMLELQKLSEEDKNKVEQLQKEREEIQNKLLEEQQKTQASLAELRQRETELAAIAAARIQQQADQSSEVITTLQEQLEKMRKDLESVETEKNTLLSIYVEGAGEGTSKQSALTEVGELMENELQCSICAELFIEAITLNCSHTFCKYCITMWKKKKKDCPICRASITAENRSIVLDNFIEKMVQNLTEEMKVKRQDILKFRAELVSEMARQTAGTSRSSFSLDESEISDDEFGEEEDDAEQFEDESEEYERERDYGFWPWRRRRYYEDDDSDADTDSGSDEGSDSGAEPTGGAGSRPATDGAAERATTDALSHILPGDLTTTPPSFRPPPERRPPMSRTNEMGAQPPLVVADTVDVVTSPASPGRTMVATGAASAAARAATGRPAAPSGSRANRTGSSANRHGSGVNVSTSGVNASSSGVNASGSSANPSSTGVFSPGSIVFPLDSSANPLRSVVILPDSDGINQAHVIVIPPDSNTPSVNLQLGNSANPPSGYATNSQGNSAHTQESGANLSPVNGANLPSIHLPIPRPGN